jgi:hypothetical protein
MYVLSISSVSEVEMVSNPFYYFRKATWLRSIICKTQIQGSNISPSFICLFQISKYFLFYLMVSFYFKSVSYLSFLVSGHQLISSSSSTSSTHPHQYHQQNSNTKINLLYFRGSVASFRFRILTFIPHRWFFDKQCITLDYTRSCALIWQIDIKYYFRVEGEETNHHNYCKYVYCSNRIIEPKLGH